MYLSLKSHTSTLVTPNISLDVTRDIEHAAMGKKKRAVSVKLEPGDEHQPSSHSAAALGPNMAPPQPVPPPAGSFGVGAPHLRLPSFWEPTPEAWFVHAEAEFAVHGIFNYFLRYNMVVAALPASTTSKLVGLLKHPPPADRYATLKQRLLYAFGLSEAERADKMLAINGLGGRRPSELMD